MWLLKKVKAIMAIVIMLLTMSIKSDKNCNDNCCNLTVIESVKNSEEQLCHYTVCRNDVKCATKRDKILLFVVQLFRTFTYVENYRSFKEYVRNLETDKVQSCDDLLYPNMCIRILYGNSWAIVHVCGNTWEVDIVYFRKELLDNDIIFRKSVGRMTGNSGVRLSMDISEHLLSQQISFIDTAHNTTCKAPCYTLHRHVYGKHNETVKCTDYTRVRERNYRKRHNFYRKKNGFVLLIKYYNKQRHVKIKTIEGQFVFENIACRLNLQFLLTIYGFMKSNFVQILVTFICFILLSRPNLFKEKNMEYDAKYSKYTDENQNYRHCIQNENRYSINCSLKVNLPEMFTFTFRTRLNYSLPVTAYPFSINHYADDVVKRHKSGEELMKYEWSRYLSFKTFPDESNVMPMRLAQAGFFYTGYGQEVKCFSCGVENSAWSIEETAMQTHRRISPDCKFIRGESTENVSIHNQDYLRDLLTNTGDVANKTRTTSGAIGGPDDVIKTDSSNEHKTSSNQNQTHDNFSEQKLECATEITPPLSRSTILNQNLIQHRPRSNMKHPEYADVSARLATYQNWKLLHIQDPVELAEAGLFYVGFKDFVRCYYCGMGLKNWEVGDNPWNEHKRWSGRCGHLARELSLERNETESEVNNCNNDVTHSKSEAPDVRSGTQQTIADIDSVAAKSVIEMGYSKETVTNAIYKCRRNNESGSLTGEAIMEIILDGCDSERSLTTKIETKPPAQYKKESRQPVVSKLKQTSQKSKACSTDAKSLAEENKALKEQKKCKICMDLEANVVFLPCGHMVSCQTCAVSLRKCAVCRELIRGCVRVYQS